MKRIFFLSNSMKVVGNLYEADGNSKKWVLFFHGGGTANKEKNTLWQQHLLEWKVNSLSIDFVGVGESEGELKNTSLESRRQNALDAMRFLIETYEADVQLVLMGSSMGGHVAASVCNSFRQIRGLMLMCPAAYSPSANNEPFDSGFTKAIIEGNDYVQSKAVVELDNFSGKLLVVYGEKDLLIPDEVRALYKYQAKLKGGQFVEITRAPHKLLIDNTKEGLRIYTRLIEYGDAFLREVFS